MQLSPDCHFYKYFNLFSFRQEATFDGRLMILKQKTKGFSLKIENYGMKMDSCFRRNDNHSFLTNNNSVSS